MDAVNIEASTVADDGLSVESISHSEVSLSSSSSRLVAADETHCQVRILVSPSLEIELPTLTMPSEGSSNGSKKYSQRYVDAMQSEIDALRIQVDLLQKMVRGDSSSPSSPGGSLPSIKRSDALSNSDSSSGSRSQGTQNSKKASTVGTEEFQAKITAYHMAAATGVAKLASGTQSSAEFVREFLEDLSMPHRDTEKYLKGSVASAVELLEEQTKKNKNEN